MLTTIELVLSDGRRVSAGPVAYADRHALLLAVRGALQAVRDRPEVVGATAWHEGGGEVWVAKMKAPEKGRAGEA